jgi:hypothetical protein
MGNYILNTKVVSFSEMWGGGYIAIYIKQQEQELKTHTHSTQ